MLNLTILSLSLSSIYSFSPLFSGNSQTFRNSHLNKCIFYVFSLNPKNFIYEKSSFKNSFGGLLQIDDSQNILESSSNKIYENETYVPNDQIVEENGDKRLVIIRYCTFKGNFYSEKSFILCDSTTITCLFTNCLFEKSSFKKTPVYLRTRATTISNICCTGLYKNSENEERIFMHTYTIKDSFINFSYSTFYGPVDDSYWEIRNAKNLDFLYLAGVCSILFQNNNISYFKTLTNKDQNALISFVAPKCLNMLMNTFTHTTVSGIIYSNLQTGNTDSYLHFIGFSNFIDNTCHKFVIKINLNTNARCLIKSCIFSNTHENNAPSIYQVGGYLKVQNCAYKTGTNGLFSEHTHDEEGCTTIENPIQLSIEYYTYKNHCIAENVENPLNCDDGACLDSNGCEEGAFDFGENDVPYNTPEPSSFFTESEVFSRSNVFDKTIEFTKSDEFSRSDKFEKTIEFTQSKGFTKTDAFEKTIEFTESDDFSRSNVFDKTIEFTKSDGFSRSNKFEKTIEFTQSDGFTKTDAFEKTIEFTKSDEFSRSDKFENTFEFTKSNVFEKTSDFTRSSVFTKTTGFTETKGFTKTTEFTKTDGFSKSSPFTISDDLNKTHRFTSSKQFSKSFAFTDSKEFDPKSAVLIEIKTENNSNLTVGMKIGIGVAVGIVVVAALAVGLFLLNRKRNNAFNDIGEETIEIADNTTNSVISVNPLNDIMSDDDPFMDEFE